MTSANGHTLAPFTVPLSGPVSAWTPSGPDVAGHGRAVVDTAGQRRHADGDTVIRALAAFVVLAVAAFAAVVSYSHIFELGRAHGQDGTAARLLPLSVDGLIAAASLVMLHAARRELDVPQLARWMLGLGVGATVAANVEYGMPFGWLAAVISAWPAVAFVGSVEMAVRFVRDSRTAAAGDMAGDDMMTPPRQRAWPDSQVRTASTGPGWSGPHRSGSPPSPRPQWTSRWTTARTRRRTNPVHGGQRWTRLPWSSGVTLTGQTPQRPRAPGCPPRQSSAPARP